MSQSKRALNYPLYTIGDLSSGIYGIGPAILLMYYMTNILGIPIGIATIAASFPKFLDLVFSPFIGSLSDRTNTRLGRRRPFLLFSAIMIFPLFLGIWAAPFDDPIKCAWFIGAFYVGCSLNYTAFLVPYCALNSEISTGYEDNTALNSYRATYSMLGCLLAGAGAPMLVEWFGGGRAGYAWMGITLAAIMSVSMLITFFQAKEPPRTVKAEKISIRDMYLAIVQNKAFFVLTTTYVLHMIAGAVMSTALAYYVTYILIKDATLLASIFFLMFGASIVAIPLFLALGKRIGKHAVFTLCLLSAIGAECLFLLLDSTSHAAAAYGVGIAVGFAEGAIQAYAYAMLVDCIQNGDQRQRAMLSGVFIAFEKFAVASGSLIAGAIFAAAGLVETMEGATAQPDSALLGIKLSVTAVPIALNVIAIFLFLLYRDFDKRVASQERLNNLQPANSTQLSISK